MCGELDMFRLEFDHIDSFKKIKQITKSRGNLENEINNIQLLCGNCHRIKTHLDRPEVIIDNRSKKHMLKR
jgi:5-methylcytosine-specific restriction endonuclease McrA